MAACQHEHSEEAYFSNLRVSNSKPEPLENAGEAAGTWNVRYASDAGQYCWHHEACTRGQRSHRDTVRDAIAEPNTQRLRHAATTATICTGMTGIFCDLPGCRRGRPKQLNIIRLQKAYQEFESTSLRHVVSTAMKMGFV